MAGKYWIKLYHEILEDPKMMRMDEVIFSRCIKIFLLAGKTDDEGYLPPVDEIAWNLRLSENEIEIALTELEGVNIVISENGRWKVRKFTERNKAMEPAEKMKRYRESKHHEEYALPISYQPVTKSIVDTDIDRKTEKDNRKITEKKQNSNAPADPVISSVADRIDPVLILSQASKLPTFPADQLGWIDVVVRMAENFGTEKTVEAMSRACTRWVNTKGKNGRNYRVTNLAWINLAQDELVGGGERQKKPSEMTDKEYLEYISQLAEAQNV